VDGRGIRRVGHELEVVLGALLDVFGLGGSAGRVCTVCVPQVGRGVQGGVLECDFSSPYVISLLIVRSFVRSFE